VRVWTAKFDAHDPQVRGEPIPDEVQRVLAALIDSATDAQDVIDIYAAARICHSSLADLTPGFVKTAQEAPNSQLAIEALGAMLLEESATVAKNNVVRQRAFSDHIGELMTKYTNQQLTSADGPCATTFGPNCAPRSSDCSSRTGIRRTSRLTRSGS
jgi:type I restriction enzyme R subunit